MTRDSTLLSNTRTRTNFIYSPGNAKILLKSKILDNVLPCLFPVIRSLLSKICRIPLLIFLPSFSYSLKYTFDQLIGNPAMRRWCDLTLYFTLNIHDHFAESHHRVFYFGPIRVILRLS